jgi:hypothetical protein
VTSSLTGTADAPAGANDGGTPPEMEPGAPAEAATAEPFRPDGAVDPRRVCLFRGPYGVLRCTLDGVQSVLRVKVVRAFPLSERERWISILDAKNKEVCLIEDPDQLDPGSRRLVEEELEQHYRIAEIVRINSIRNEYRTMYWDVETDRGRREFIVKWTSDTVLWPGPRELLLVDIDTNRFHITDIQRLDAHSRSQLSVLL